jgi:hypothetical protein
MTPTLTAHKQVEQQLTVDEGPVVLTMPEQLSAESVDDFEYWMTGIIRRLRRNAGMSNPHDAQVEST